MSDFQSEQSHFAETLAIIRSEREKTEQELGIVEGNDRFIQVVDDGSGEAAVQQLVLRMKLQGLHQLCLSEKRPYFARVDFTPMGMKGVDGKRGLSLLPGIRLGEKASVYLGRWGVMKTPEHKVCVADWRSPVANLYYSGQIGRVSYEAPDGRVEGELSLKRMFTVEESRLLAMQDTELAGQEQYLTEALSQVATSRLREVVTTIQAEQNRAIRHNPFLPLFVQGVAGSGKTTVALHRVAWLLYRLQKNVEPRQVMVIAPSPLFLSYISRVLPDLGVEQVRQTTFPQLCEALLGRRMPTLEASSRLEERLRMTKAQRDALDQALRLKGSLSLGKALDEFLDRFEMAAAPSADVVFGSKTLLSADETADLFLRQLRHFPLLSRAQELRKVVKRRLQEAVRAIEDALRKATNDRLETFLETLPDGDERREKVGKLLASREDRLAQLKAAQEEFWNGYNAAWRPMDLLTVYGEFWREYADGNPAALTVWESTRPLFLKGRICAEDLPAQLWLGLRLYGYPRMDIRHVVIDEAQDVSPLQILALRRLFGHDAFTLVGDLWQGIFGDEGIRDWDALSEGIFNVPPAMVTLAASYRSTAEIMEFALGFQKRAESAFVLPHGGLPHILLPTADVKAALGCSSSAGLRHGPAPAVLPIGRGEKRQALIARTVQDWLSEGFFSIAVIVKTEVSAKRLYTALQNRLPQARLVLRGDYTFEGGVQVMGAGVVKGLEFDCVLIADADGATYPLDTFYNKLLYVLCSRPLHRLALMGMGILGEDGRTLSAHSH